MKKLIAGAMIAAGFGLGLAVPAQAAPCAYNDPNDHSSGSRQLPCGIPDLKTSADNSRTNLKNNLKNNLDVGKALKNLQHNLTGGIGSDDSS